MLGFWIRADLDEPAFRGDELREFGPALNVLKKEGLLKRGEDLQVVECLDCGHPHLEDVDVITDSAGGVPRAYIRCGAGRAGDVIIDVYARLRPVAQIVAFGGQRLQSRTVEFREQAGPALVAPFAWPGSGKKVIGIKGER